ncbi:hypothetical protein LCGC14_1255870 [marine sediment metagenome]|uniref:Uncharacterized protein n=1 Tax=marine sediment metagenome TaxID=412755 RepID=A0A0F9LND4_9ZZZZ
MSMTELERAKQGQACASAVWDEHYERFGVGMPKWINKSLAYWQCRVTELEAAEKQAEKRHMTLWETLTDLRERFGRLIEQMDHLLADQEAADAKIDRLTADVERLQAADVPTLLKNIEHDANGMTCALSGPKQMKEVKHEGK